MSELVETGGGWRPCPGGPAINVDTERWVAQCPHCDYTFSTLMDEPVVPPHDVSLNGEAVMFRGQPSFNSEHYELCTDSDCPVRYAYEAEQGQPHWHFTGNDIHPAWDVP